MPAPTSTSPRFSPPPSSHSHSHSASSGGSRSRSPPVYRTLQHRPSPSPSPPQSPSPPASPSPSPGFLVRALHSFSPSTLAASGPGSSEQTNSCLTFQAGDLIRCLNMDESGWWDGELVGSSGAAGGGSEAGKLSGASRVRGWFPRNYVEVLEDEAEEPPSPTPPTPPAYQLSPEAHTLLSSIEQNVGLLENAANAGRKGHYQPSTACVISSIRTVLSATSSLTRDSPILRSHPPLSAARKKILSSLAALVNAARKASAPSLPLPPDQEDSGEIERQEKEDAREMMRVAEGTVECVKGFLEEAEKRGVEVNLGLGVASPAAASPLLAPAGAGGEGGAARDLRAAKSMGNLRDRDRRPTLEALQLPVTSNKAGAFPVRNPSTSTIRPLPSPSAGGGRSPSVVSTTTPTETPSSSTSFLPSTTSLAPSGGPTLTLRTPSALSSHLSTLHDSLLSTLAALIGHVHSHARSTSPASSFAQLIDLTREGIERVRDCLVVVERVGAEVVRRGGEQEGGEGEVADKEEMRVLAGARERLYEATTALVSAARVATSPSSPSVSPSKGASGAAAARERERERERDEDERKALLGAATGVLRAGGDCVGAVKLVVSQLFSAAPGGGGEEMVLVLPRPKTSEELADEAASEAGRGGADERALSARAAEEGDEDDGEDVYLSAGEGNGAAGGGGAGGKYSDAPSGDERDSPSLGAAARPTATFSVGGSADSTPRRPRNPHTLSMLGRKATSLGNLRGRFEEGLRLEEVGGEGADEEREEEDGSGGSTATAETARTSDLSSASSVRGAGASPVRHKMGHDRVKTSSISLSPAHAKKASFSSSSASASARAPSPSPSMASSVHSPPVPQPGRSTSPTTTTTSAPHRPSSTAMSRAYSSGSGHSARSARSARSAQSSSRATAVSTTSTVATAQTAETSPRNSFQSSGAGAGGGGVKRSTRPGSGSAGVRTSLGSVWEASPPLPGNVPSTPSPLSPPPPSSPAGTATASAAPSSSLAAPRASTPDRARKNSTNPPFPLSPASRKRTNSTGGASVPWFLERDYPPAEVSFNADGHVSGGTLRCLVERMTLHDTTIDAGFSNAFLLTFRMYATPLDLAQLLFRRFDSDPPVNPETGAGLTVDEMKQWTASKLTPIRLRIYNLFKTWVENYWLHDPDREVVDPLLEWCRGRLRAAMPTSASNRLIDLINKRVAAAEQQQASTTARSSLEELAQHSPSNASTTSLGSFANGSTVSLALTPSISRGTTYSTASGSTGGGGGGGGLLHRMQSTPSLRGGSASRQQATAPPPLPSIQDSYSPSVALANGAPLPVTTKALLSALRPSHGRNGGHVPSVVDIDPLELARQLTIMESRVYCAIRPDELLGSSGISASTAGGKGGSALAGDTARNANVRKMSALSTRLTGWIAETILGEQDQKRRTGLVKYFVKLGERLLALSNYNALFAVFTALNSSTIARLRRTWEGLAPKYKATFETLRKATDHARNYAEYRQKIRQAVPPCLPFVGLFLTDLIFVFEGNRAERPSPADPSLRLINFDRYHKMARIVGELQRFQSPHQLVEVPEIQYYLAQQLEGLKNGQDAQSLYRQSLLIEPRQPHGPASSAASTHSSDSRSHARDVFNWRG
ncbi:hypothetical protein JCM6882_002382 [Rhodosporidiobolus microsporus]